MRHHLLTQLGWTEDRDEAFVSSTIGDLNTIPGRIVRHDRIGFTVFCEHGDVFCEIRGRLRSQLSPVELPSVGDWVEVSVRTEGRRAGSGEEKRGSVEGVLPRTSALLRSAVGRATEAQISAANVDTVLVTVPLDAAANPRRLERQLAMVWESGATPVVVITKADLGGDSEWINDVAMGVTTVLVDSITGDGIEALDPWLVPGKTLVLLGPSGAGKSTLANCLLGEDRLATGAVRGDDKRGRHTTTWRELVVLKSGALLIDTPGIRELALWDGEAGIAATFSDVEVIMENCRFSDCGHTNEPGCAIHAALADGSLAEERFASWNKLQREMVHHEMRHNARLRADEQKKWAARSKEARGRTRP